MRRMPPVLLTLLLATAAACSGGGSAGSSGGNSSAVPTAQTLPRQGTVRLPDRRIYTVSAPGATLRLDDISLRIVAVGWQRHVQVPFSPPGTRTFAVVTAKVHNLGTRDATITPTQIWLIDGQGHTFLAAARSNMLDPLIGQTVPAGGSVSGVLVYPMPDRRPGSLLVYRFADARAIARATHVGVARYS
ncbi:MAG: DUF4352 domain-containing protein [Gaiellales bacterium]